MRHKCPAISTEDKRSGELQLRGLLRYPPIRHLLTEQLRNRDFFGLNNVRVQDYLSNDNDLVSCTVVVPDSHSTIEVSNCTTLPCVSLNEFDNCAKSAA
jgi:hypothetical protein